MKDLEDAIEAANNKRRFEHTHTTGHEQLFRSIAPRSGRRSDFVALARVSDASSLVSFLHLLTDFDRALQHAGDNIDVHRYVVNLMMELEDKYITNDVEDALVHSINCEYGEALLQRTYAPHVTTRSSVEHFDTSGIR
eukprot:GHVU01084175.1.p2 GENE.GHVU01084175.1~~GHVU01084175.1.p2  ORF type:complete len:138 (+),score=10.29 GHVU01084175.1:4067-4480(+)